MLLVNQLSGFGAGRRSAPVVKALTWRSSAFDAVDRAGSYTFASQSIGPAAADRYVIVGAAASNNSNDIASVTVGGISATKLVSAIAASAHAVSLWIAAVPTGSTANIVVTLGQASANRCGIGVWSATGLPSATPVDTGSDTGTGTLTDTLTTVAGGFFVGFGHMGYGGGGSITWTNATERFDQTIEAGVVNTGADAVTTGASISPQVSGGTSTVSCVVFATW